MSERMAPEAGGAAPHAAWPDVAAGIVRTLLSDRACDPTVSAESLLAEIEELGRVIAAAKAEIAELTVEDINASHIPLATDELDAIVAHTAAATDDILEACETLDRVGASLSGEAAARMQEATTRIYEACGFQDITGQRITKVVEALKKIEHRVSQIVLAFGRRDAPPAATAPSGPGPLLNGPQLPAHAMDQSDIDRLMDGFG